MQTIRQETLRALALAPASARELAARLGISQPSMSRVLSGLRKEVGAFGRARATRYARYRVIEGVSAPIPMYEIRPQGQHPRLLGRLHPIWPNGFYLEGLGATLNKWFEDLPWFLSDLWPSGYLGRQLPLRHPGLGTPPNIRLWSADHVLRYLTRYGWDGVGSLILGEEPYGHFLASLTSLQTVAARDRADVYPDWAMDTLARGPAGSSAAGEQPKFLAIREDVDLVPVLVKFSPPLEESVGQRRGDLLVAEHLGLTTLLEHGQPAARSSLLFAGGRVFLEVERFDRQGPHHRVGQVAAEAVDAEFVGELTTWTALGRALLADGRLNPEEERRIRWLERFGELIGNSDRHLGNLSFRLSGVELAGLAPAYDMLPMCDAPMAGELPLDRFGPAPLGPADTDIAEEVLPAAVAFWCRVAADSRVSEGYRAIAADRAVKVEIMAELLAWLPRVEKV